MKGINRVTILGTLGQDPEVKYTANGKTVANLSMATSESWKDQQGQQQEKTEWHRVVLWGKTAEIAGEYLRKGSQAYIEGKLQTRKWQDQSGQDRYTTEIVVQGYDGKLQLIGGRNNQQQGQPQPTTSQQPQNGQQSSQPEFDDQIPFMDTLSRFNWRVI